MVRVNSNNTDMGMCIYIVEHLNISVTESLIMLNFYLKKHSSFCALYLMITHIFKIIIRHLQMT